jgi:hypothetical protein
MITNNQNSISNTIFWIPTKGCYPQFNKILSNIEKLKLKNVIFVITYERFNLKTFSLLKSKKFNQFFYLKKSSFNRNNNNNNFENILTIINYLKKKYKFNFKYLMISSDDDELINRKTYIQQFRIMNNNKDISFVTAPMIMIGENKDKIKINLNEKTLSGIEFIKEFTQSNNLQHATINSVFRINYILQSSALKGLSLYKKGLWDGFGIDYNLYLKLAFIREKKIKIINSDPTRVVVQHTESMTSQLPIQFSYCYYLYCQYLKKELKKKYKLKNKIFEDLILIRIKEMIRCYFVVQINKKIESININKSIPKNFLIFCIINSFKELNFKNFISVLKYIFSYYIIYEKKIFVKNHLMQGYR